MDPTTVVCPNLACPARGHIDQGNMDIHARKDQRCICTQCRTPCAATQGTACDRLRTPAETVALVRMLLAHGCPLHALVVACGCDERTGAAWWARSGRQGVTGTLPDLDHPHQGKVIGRTPCRRRDMRPHRDKRFRGMDPEAIEREEWLPGWPGAHPG